MPPTPVDAMANRFAVLVRHCFRQFFDTEHLAPQASNEAALSQVLGLLAVPPAFFTLLFRPFGITGWTLNSIRYLFVSYSMTVIAFVIVMKWDALLPDRRDYLILRPLPLRMGTLFLAKVASLGLFAGAFLIVLNFFGILFWTGIDGKPDIFRSVGVHACLLLASGLFAALAAAAIQGLLMTLFSGVWLRRATTTVQTLLLGFLVMVFVLIPLMGPMMSYLVKVRHPLLYWFPPYWFMGLYEQMRPATTNPLLSELGERALPALGVSALVFLVTYWPGYHRHARRSMDAPQTSPSGPGRFSLAYRRLLHSTILKEPVERAAFHFISQTMARSMKHRIFLAAYGGLGAALSVITYLSGRGGFLELPLTLSFILVSGLRAAFNFPSELRANWTLQIGETSLVNRYAAATRKWILISAVVPLFLLLLPVQFAVYSWPVALYRTAYGIGLTAVLIEIMFFSFRKVPFTCAYFPGKMNLVGLSVLYVFGFTTYSSVMSSVQESLLRFPAAALLFLPALVVACRALNSAAERHMRDQGSLDFKSSDPVVCTLNLGQNVVE